MVHRSRTLRLCCAALALIATIGLADAHGSKTCGRAERMKALAKAGLMPAMRTAAMGVSDTDVLKYDLDIEAKLATREIVGSNAMTVKSMVSGLLHFQFWLSNAYTITGMTLDGRPIPYTRLSPEVVEANFDQACGIGQTFVLRVAYSGVAPSGGFGSISFGTRSSGAQYVETLSEPWYAYTWWPVKEDNTDKALVDIAVTVPNTLIVASNGTLKGTDSLTGGRLRYRWGTNYPITPYLVSFAASNYRTWSTPFTYDGGTMPVDFFIWPEYDSTSNRTKWNDCIQMLSTFGDKYGLYPFSNEKYGIYNFTFGGGMEHQTITGQGGFSENLTSHELAHQWWGDMVTCAKWEDIWLNEGFATYSEAIFLENKPGSSGLPALKSAMQSRKPSSYSGTVYCTNPTDVNRIFDYNLSYLKGGWVLHQLRHVVGDSAFFAILAEYRRRHAYSTATTEDFVDVCQDVYGSDLGWFFQEWVFQPGAVAYQYGTSTVVSNGKQYLQVMVKQNQIGTYPTYTMPIDFAYILDSKKTVVKLWNTARTQHYVIPVPGAPQSWSLDGDGWILTSNVSTTTYVAGPPKVVGVSPSPSDRRIATDVVKVTFHTPVHVNASHFAITDSSGKQLPFAMRYSSSTNTATLILGRATLGPGAKLTIKDGITAVNSGQKLDGEWNTSGLPSGDGLPGGDCVVQYPGAVSISR